MNRILMPFLLIIVKKELRAWKQTPFSKANMINDRITCGSVAGMIASLAKTTVNFSCYLLGLTKILYPNLIGIVLFKSTEEEASSFWNLLLGFFVDIVIDGGILGILIIYWISFTPQKHFWYKSFLCGNLVYLVSRIGLYLTYPKAPLNFHWVSLFDHLLFSLITYYLIKKLSPAIEGENLKEKREYLIG